MAKQAIEQFTVYGEHRSLALAERHARELARRHTADVEIVARRNDSGRYSKRGRNFTFEVTPREKEKKEQEYILAVRYKSPRGRKHYGTVQASIFAPEGTSKSELKESVYQALTGGAARFRVNIIKWQTRR